MRKQEHELQPPDPHDGPAKMPPSRQRTSCRKRVDCRERLEDFQGEDRSCHLEGMGGPTGITGMSAFVEEEGVPREQR